MKAMNKYFIGLVLGGMTLGLASCSDFDEINSNPSAVTADKVNADWFLAESFGAVQQNPNDNERVFVYNWASISRVIGDNTFGCVARYSDEYNGCMYNFSSSSIKGATNAIKIVNENLEAGNYTNEHDVKYNENVREMARIWRVMVIADFADVFGPYALDAFQGVNPHFNSVQDVYNWMFTELTEAQANLHLDVTATDAEKKQDVAYNGNFEMWQKLANSLRLRYAMRLSEVDKAKAQTEFEAAVQTGKLMTAQEDLLGFPTAGGWSNWENVYNRGWNDNVISSSMVNIMSGLGGVTVADNYAAISGSSKDITPYVKPMTYLGIEYKNHTPANTDNPTKFMWLDGIPENVDPRAFVYYTMPNDPTAKTYHSAKAGQTLLEDVPADISSMSEDEVKGISGKLGEYQGMRDEKGAYVWGRENTTFTFNGALAGLRPAWNDKTFKNNYLNYYSWDTSAFLAKNYNEAYANNVERVWFGPWETYFLLAEGAVRGWNAGISAEEAYNNGIRSNFEYLGIGAYADAYINSESYNRVGTSVKFTHTAEPQSFEATYYDGYENQFSKVTFGDVTYYGVVTGRGALKTKTYNYPDANKILYKGKKLNDQLTKIITQKYIANTPYVVVEQWNDRRRLGLPFFEVPGSDSSLTGSDFDNDKTNGYDPIGNPVTSTGQKWNMFTQRMRYPTSLENADPEEYKHALELLGGGNFMTTPLWWAIH